MVKRNHLVHWLIFQCFVVATTTITGHVKAIREMKQLLILTLFSTVLLVQTVFARTVEVDVHGMTCAFCVDSLERKLGNMESVSKVQVSMKTKKVRLETDGDRPSIETIKQTILDAGFTPTNITVLSDQAYQK